jgi:hypothetical protein
MVWLIDILKRWFVFHQWVAIDDGRRYCSICGRRETYDEVMSIEGSVWNCTWKGHPKAHFAVAQQKV